VLGSDNSKAIEFGLAVDALSPGVQINKVVLHWPNNDKLVKHREHTAIISAPGQLRCADLVSVLTVELHGEI